MTRATGPAARRRRRAGTASALALTLVAGVLTFLAVRGEGEVVRRTDLHDGGVWVTNGQRALLGRLNRPAQQLDAGVAVASQSAGSGLDVLQDGSAVVDLGLASNQAIPVDAASASLQTSGALTLPTPAASTGLAYARQRPVDLRGGTAAVVDPATGKVWAQRVPTGAGAEVGLDRLQPTAKPLATLGATAVVAVGVDGTVYAASGATGALVTIPVNPASGDLDPPVKGRLGFTTKALELTAVGQRWVAFDAATGRLTAAGLSKPADLGADAGDGGLVLAALQEPGPAAPAVLLGGPDGLSSVALDDGGATGTLVDLPDTARRGTSGAAVPVQPTAPVRLGDCVHAAWATPGSAWYGRACGAAVDGGDQAPGGKPVQAVELGGGLGKATRRDGVRLRTNRGLIVLNDLDSGNVWDLTNTPVKIDDWDAVVPPPQQQDENAKKDPNQRDDQVVKTPPKAEPDQVEVRAGRTSTLHVLDNDSDAAGSILAIAPGDVTRPEVPGVRATVSGDGQAVELSVPTGVTSRSFSFRYTVNNGGGGATSRSTATVTVRVVDDGVNTAPHVRQGSASLTTARYVVTTGGRVTIGVVADWRDDENDPLTVTALDPGVGVDPSGALTVTAGGKRGAVAVHYRVDDGRGGSTPAQTTVTVLGPDDRAVPPVPQPDVIRAVAGKPVQVQPLGNDVPGADPTTPGARLHLAAALRGPGQLTLDTNLDTGTVTVTGSTPGTFFLTYGAQVGTAVGTGRIRVDVQPDPSGDAPPVAVPDAATLQGELPTVVDVLTNDYSPRGDVLVVQKVTTGDQWLRASVVQGHWLRIQATGPLTQGASRSGTLQYTISDGTATAVGQVSVTQKPVDPQALVPHVEDDTAIVRTGDVVTIPVLDNDSVSGGVPLVLDRDVKVVDGKGEAFASGTVVRYVPDPTPVTSDTVVTLEYSTHPEGGTVSVTGRVQVTVTPLPTPTTPDQAPVARSFSASVTAGDTITLTVPTSGIDPDGDLCYVVGVVGAQEGAVDLQYGRVLGTGPSTIKYEAYPRSAGTEVIRYAVRDRFGKTGEGLIRVGVVQPGDPQPPVAVEDDVVAAPGRTVTVDPLENDLVSPDDQVTYDDFARLDDPATVKEFTRDADGTFSTTAPAEDAPKVLTYGITDGLFDPSRSTVTVRGKAGFDNPPIAVDDVAQPKPGETAVTVDVLANDRDPDGPHDALKVVRAVGPGVSVVGAQVRITLLDHPRVVPYVIEDGDGATAMALVYVPTATDGAPYVTAGKVVQLDANSTTTVDLAQYVTDPRGRAVRVTSPDTVSTSPRAYLSSAVTSDTRLTLTSGGDYTGPAALMLEVTDQTSPDDPSAVTAYLSIPVQVGPLTPVLRCPTYGVALVADGPARTVDVPRLCHAWFPTGLDQASVRYVARWTQRTAGVDLRQQGTGGAQVVLQASPSAPTGTGALEVGVEGGQQFPVGVTVTRASPLSVRPITVDGLVAGSSRTVDVTPYLDSPLSAPRCTVSGVRTVSGSGVTAAASGCRLTVTAGQDARRQAVVALTVSDAPGRTADTQATVTIKAPPDAPTGVGAVPDTVAGGQARVSWSAPGYDGGFPVDEYRVTASGGPVQTCQASPCTITGLTNGRTYTFTVAARNAVGWSPESPVSNGVVPDRLPARPTVGATTPGDRTLLVTWSPPPSNGASATQQYQVAWVDKDGGSGGGTATVAGSATSYRIAGLVNDDRYGVTVRARNQLGFGPSSAEVVAQSVGTPATVPAPQVASRTPGPDDADAQVTIGWSPVDPNGPDITTYTVYRDGKAIAQTSPSQRTATDTVPYDGATHQYSVTATNGGNKTSAKGGSTPFKADGVPQTPSVNSVATNRADYSADATWTVRDSRSTGYQRLNWRTGTSSGSFACSGSCPGGGRLGSLGTTPNQQVQIQVVNAAGKASTWSAPSRTFDPYGPTRSLTGLHETHDGSSITFSWDPTPANGRPIVHYQLSGSTSGTTTATSYTFSGLGYSTSRTLTVAPVAADSGAGPSQTVTGTTDKAPAPEPTMSVTRGPSCGSTCGSNCTDRSCGFIDVVFAHWAVERVSCSISDTHQPPAGWRPQFADSADGEQALVNASGYRPYYGYFGYQVTVTCNGHRLDGTAVSKTDTYTWPNSPNPR